jgi:hypothetical protein
MKKAILLAIILTMSAFLMSCAHYPPDRYNTQKGALIGAGAGALLGQAIGGNTGGTLIGLAAGTVLGGLVGNAVDQDYQAAREAAQYQKQVVYYDKNGSAVEAIPGQVDPKENCRKVTKRVWQDGKVVSENIEEICTESPSAPPQTVVVQPQYAYPPPPAYVYPYPYYYPSYPGIYLRFGSPYRYPHHRYRRW